MLPKQLEKYFWDTEPKKLDIAKYKFYIIERLLEMGDEKAVAWLKKTFKQKEMFAVLQKSRKISGKSRNYWNLVLNN